MIVIAKEARQDLIDIAIYTKEKWGIKQRNIYVTELDSCFKEIEKNPYLGRKRENIRKGIYSRLHQKHMILYKLKGEELHILRVLHQSRDIHQAFD